MNKVVITESIEQNKDFVSLLNQNKIEIIVLPVIKTIPLIISYQIKDIFLNLNNFDWIVFDSINSVRYFFYILMNQFLKLPVNSCKVACFGEKTINTLKTYTKKIDFILTDENFSGSVRKFLENQPDLKNSKILLPSSFEQRGNYEKIVSDLKLNSTVLPIFETKKNNIISEALIKQILENENLIFSFFNINSLKYLLEFIPSEKFLSSWKLIAGDDEIAEELYNLGFKNIFKSQKPEANFMIKKVIEAQKQ